MVTKRWARACVEPSLVQILVAVANNQMRTLMAEVKNGFVRTALGYELVAPKP